MNRAGSTSCSVLLMLFLGCLVQAIPGAAAADPDERKDSPSPSTASEQPAGPPAPSIPAASGAQSIQSGKAEDSPPPNLRDPLVPEPGKSENTALTEEIFNEYSESAPPSKEADDETDETSDTRDEPSGRAEPDPPTEEPTQQPPPPESSDSREQDESAEVEEASQDDPAGEDIERLKSPEPRKEGEPDRAAPPEAPIGEAIDGSAPASDPRTTRDEVIEEISQDAPPTRSPTPEPPAPSPPAPPDAAPRSAEKEPIATDAGGEEEPQERPRLRVWLDRGLRIERDPDHFRLKIGGRLFFDGAYIGGDESIRERFDTGGFGSVRQARIDFTGTLGSRIYYKFQVDVTGESSSDLSEEGYLKYFFVGVTGLGPLGRAEVGVIKEPISMSMLTSGLNVDFQERALPTLFAPSWNVGFVLRNEVLDNRLSWTFGVFRGDDAAGSEDTPVDIVGRIATVLWSKDDGSRFVHVGAAYKLETGGRFNVRYKTRPETSFGDNWVDTGSIPAKRSHVVGFELAGLLQPISFQSEVLASFVERDSGPVVRLWGAYLQVSYFLTGERRHYLRRQRVFGRVQLNHPFSWKAKTWGAFELTGRYSYLTLDSHDIRGGTINNTTLGLNWYLLPNVRIMTNYIHSHLNGTGSGNIGSVRFQIDY